MPNLRNIESPITLFGYGRSGTSVLYRSFALHPDVDTVGESANLIFTTWRALEQISGLTRYGKIEKKDYGADAAQLVRQAFLTVFPSDKNQWMHKPINTPRILRDLTDGESDSDTFVAWYWNVFTRSFPASRNLAVVRNPCDVVISARKYSDFIDSEVWRSLRFIYRMLIYRKEHFRIVLRYEDMIARPAETLKQICDAVGLDFNLRMPDAFERLHVPVKGTMFGTAEELAGRRKAAFSHRDEHNSLVLDDAAKRTLESYQDVLSLFGLPLDEQPLTVD
jgi:hypothetical protein